MKLLGARLMLAGIMIFINGCTTLPVDTINKKIAVFELTYNQILTTVKTWNDEGRLLDSQKSFIKERVKEISNARSALFIAKNLGDLDTAQGRLNAANVSLNLLREFIKQQESPP